MEREAPGDAEESVMGWREKHPGMLRSPSSLKQKVTEQGIEHPLQYQDSIILSFLQKAEFREIPACNCRQA